MCYNHIMNDFYVYSYLREDGTPYYIGKGTGGRYYHPNHRCEIPPRDRIEFLFAGLTPEWASFLEMEYIDFYGRLDDGTGILENLTDGGDGNVGRVVTDHCKKRASETHKGKEVSEETRRRQSISAKERGFNGGGFQKGNEPPNKGKKYDLGYWWTDGKQNKRQYECPGIGWWRGRANKQ